MKNLVSYIKQLQKEDVKYFYKAFEKHQKKLDCFDLILKNQVQNDEELCVRLGYGENKQAFHTFKHRVTEALLVKRRLVDCHAKLQDLEEKTFQLRNLLYSTNSSLVGSKLISLKKRAYALESYRCLSEITLCEVLMYHNDIKRRATLEVELALFVEKERIFRLASLEFFKILFAHQDHFYGTRHAEIDQDATLHMLRSYYEQVPSELLEFFVLTTELSLQLDVLHFDAKDAQFKLKRISELYSFEKVASHLPHFGFALECLYCKYYLRSRSWQSFTNSVLRLEALCPDMVGTVIYESFYVFYVYAKIYLLFIQNQQSQLSSFLSTQILYFEEGGFLGRYRSYYYYFQALACYYRGELGEVDSSLSQVRKYKGLLNESDHWILIESSLLLIVISVEYGNAALLDAEIKGFKYLVSKLPNRHLFHAFIKSCTKYRLNSSEENYDNYLKEFYKFKISTITRFIEINKKI